MNSAGAFYHPPGGQPYFAVAMPAPPYAPASASYPAATAVVPVQPLPTPYYSAAAAVPVQPLPAPCYAAAAFRMQPAPLPPPFRVHVRAVWADTLDAARRDMGYFAAHARCVAVKVHYPGVVFHAPVAGAGALAAEKHYATLKANTDALKPLQVGIAVCTDDGRVACWEFNLCDFDPAADQHAAGSLAHLQSRGLCCLEHRLRGIPMAELTALLRRSGLLGNRPGVSWITHAGAYHLAYLMKVIGGGKPLPGDVAGFLASLRRSLGEDVYDVATMAADCPNLPVGLEQIALSLRLPMPLSAHSLAGAGSVLALEAFLKLKPQVFRDNVARYRGVLQGLHSF
ncbi:unnamed protein product [Urochloa decumbens]|uniref:Uncharacterized protein n=1 Tax=Urochloa decumbens TaxID=240449 RepID=A0ABC8WVU7_9POAL